MVVVLDLLGAQPRKDDAVVAVSVIGSLIGLGAALFSGLCLCDPVGLWNSAKNALRRSMLRVILHTP